MLRVESNIVDKIDQSLEMIKKARRMMEIFEDGYGLTIKDALHAYHQVKLGPDHAEDDLDAHIIWKWILDREVILDILSICKDYINQTLDGLHETSDLGSQRLDADQRVKLAELKAAWFAETHRGDDMDTGKLRELEQEISRIEDQITEK